jgi:pimeloyl-ACP methyl ester carboxylesterase
MRLATTAEKAVRLLEIGWSADVCEAARKLKCPVLAVHAERDRAVPISEGRLLAGLIRTAVSFSWTVKIICRCWMNLTGHS